MGNEAARQRPRVYLRVKFTLTQTHSLRRRGVLYEIMRRAVNQ